MFNILKKINRTGLRTVCFKSVEQDHIIIKIHAPLDVLKKFADQLDFIIKLDQHEAKARLEAGNAAYRIGPVRVWSEP